MKKPESPKERNLIKGAIRRVFSRSELRRQCIENAIIKHEDLSRPRVKNWCWCPICKNPIPKSYMQVDHIDPVIQITDMLENMTWDDVVNRMWCSPENLMPICKDCHKAKTLEENRLRRKYRKEIKNV